jgi:hypothetical protein
MPKRRSLIVAHLGIVALVACLVSGWWFIRGGLTYGWADVLAQRRHDAVVIGQPQYAHFGVENWQYFFTTLFHSFVAQFGWMTIVIDDMTYAVYGSFILIAVIGLRGDQGRSDRIETICLLAVVMVSICQVLYYNVSFVQAQGRYLFPSLGPIGVFLARGWVSSQSGWRPSISWPRMVWIAVAIATAIGGLGDWDLTWRSMLVGAGALIGVRGLLGGGASGPRVPRFAALTVVALGALNLMCLARYVIPFYRG